MNQENAYSKGCEVKYLLKSKTTQLAYLRIAPLDSKSTLQFANLKSFRPEILFLRAL